MKASKKVLEIFEDYRELVDDEINRLLDKQSDFLMYDMMKYFFGYLDEDLKSAKVYGGKRFRPSICLILSDMYEVKDKAVEIASSIEIFHQFTLIHDDIEDRDEWRRGRPTVWHKWGINHGINTGDAQFNLAIQELIKVAEKYPEFGVKVGQFLNQIFLQVIEGQFLDFTLEELSLADENVNEEKYFAMIERKTSVIIGAAAKVAGMVAGKEEKELESLYQYGLNLGLAFQLRDDLLSIWASQEQTGKKELKDIIERKKTLPILYLLSKLKDKNKLVDLYDSKNELSEDQAKEIKKMLDEHKIYDLVWKKVEEHMKKSAKAIDDLSISDEHKNKLKEIGVALLSPIK